MLLVVLIPNLGVKWAFKVNAILRLLNPLETAPVPIAKVLWTSRPALTSREKRQIYCHPEFEPHTVQSVASRYTDYDISSLKCKVRKKFRIFVVKRASTLLVTIRVV